MQKHKNINAYILAGGLSSRMGTEKGLVLLNGKPFVQHILTALQFCFDVVSINTSNSSYQTFGLPLVSDRIPKCGPLSGIHACLSHCEQDFAFIISCDLPLIQASSISKFLQQWDQKELIQVLISKGQIEPLFGIYAKSLLPEIEKQLQEKNWSVLQFVKQHPHRTVELNQISHHPEIEYQNINSPNELYITEKKLSWAK